jgi:hypothetical protein
MGIEKNIKASFRDVKLEMISIKNQILKLAEAQNELKHVVDSLQANLKKKASKKSK